MQVIKIKDIITVIHEGWRFTGKQGRVEEIVEDGNKDGPIGVSFPAYYGRILDYPYEPGNIVRFQRDDLKINDRDEPQDISRKQLYDFLFGRSMWHSEYLLDYPLMIGFTECMHKGCEKKVVARIIINCHGVISEADVCKDHMGYHGHNCDGFPYK